MQGEAFHVGDWRWRSAAAASSVTGGRTLVHATGAANFHGTETCTCVVQGRAGTLLFGFEGTGEPNGTFVGHFVILSGTGGLRNLRGQGSIMGPGPGSVSGTYSGEIHFEPNS